MQVNRTFSAHAAQGLAGPSSASRSKPTGEASPSPLSSPIDQLDLSPEARALGQASGAQSTSGVQASSGDIRVDRVAEIRRAIASGTYETPEKISAALDRILDEYA